MICKEMQALGEKRSVIREIFEYGNKRKRQIGKENVFDFSLGNPGVPAPEIVKQTLLSLLQNTDPVALHGYTSAPGDPEVRAAIAEYLGKTYGVKATAADFYLTAGAAAALTATLCALVNPGEEVLALAPFFPEYRVFTARAGGVFTVVAANEETFGVNFEALEKALSPKSAALIINSPNNPSGAVLSAGDLDRLASLLEKKAKEYGHPIYLIADEPYRELVYDGEQVPYPTLFYRNTIVCYSFSKSLSLPGERIGYVFVSPEAEDNRAIMAAVAGAGRSLGYVCAPSFFQYLIPPCLGKTADLSLYKENRDLLYRELSALGFAVTKPEGAFYLFVKAPGGDAAAFAEAAKSEDILFVPGDDFGCPGYVRIAYCVSTETAKRSIPAFRRLAEKYRCAQK